MVSFFGIKFGAKKKQTKSVQGRSETLFLDPPFDGYGGNQGSRPETAHSMMQPPQGPYMNAVTSASLQDLTQHSRNMPSLSSLRPANSDANLGRNFGNGSSPSLVPPPVVGGGDSSRPRSGSLPRQQREDWPRPGTTGGAPRKSIANSPHDRHFERRSRYSSPNSSLSHSPRTATSPPHSGIPPPQGPPPLSNLPAPPDSPATSTSKSPLGQFQLKLNLPDSQDNSLMSETMAKSRNPHDGEKDEVNELPPRKESLASLGESRPGSPSVRSSTHIAEPGTQRQTVMNWGRKGSAATAISTRASDASSFYSVPSPTRSSMTPHRESKDSRASTQYGKRPSHAHQYKLSLSTQTEEDMEDKHRQSHPAKYTSTEHLSIDLSKVPSPSKSNGPPIPSTTGKNSMRLPSLHLDKTSLIPSPLQSPAVRDASPPIPSPPPVSSHSLSPQPPAENEGDYQAGGEHGSHGGIQPQFHPPPQPQVQPHSEDLRPTRNIQSEQRDGAVSPPSPRTRRQLPMLAPIATNTEPRVAPIPPRLSQAPPYADNDRDSDRHSGESLCTSPTWEGFWGPKKAKKKLEKQRKKEEKKRLKEQKKAAKSPGRRTISAPVPIHVPESAAAAPPLPSPILPGYTGDVRVTPLQSPSSPAVRAMTSTTSLTMSPRMDSPMLTSRVMSSATMNTMSTTLRVESPTATRAVSPAGTFAPTLRSPGVPPTMSPPLGSARSHDGRFPNVGGRAPIPAPGTPELESPRKAPIPPSPTMSVPLVSGSPRFRETQFSSIDGRELSQATLLESPRKAPSPPMSPRSVGTHSTAKPGRFDSILSRDSSFDVDNSTSPPKSHMQGLSPRERHTEPAPNSDPKNESELPRFSTIAKSQFAPAPLSPAPRAVGLASPPPQDDAGAKQEDHDNDLNYDEPSDDPSPSPLLGMFQTPLLQQGGFSQTTCQSPESLSRTDPPSIERPRINAPPPHMSPSFGGGPETRHSRKFSLDSKPTEQSRLVLSDDDLSRDEDAPKDSRRSSVQEIVAQPKDPLDSNGTMDDGKPLPESRKTETQSLQSPMPRSFILPSNWSRSVSEKKSDEKDDEVQHHQDAKDQGGNQPLLMDASGHAEDGPKDSHHYNTWNEDMEFEEHGAMGNRFAPRPENMNHGRETSIPDSPVHAFDRGDRHRATPPGRMDPRNFGPPHPRGAPPGGPAARHGPHPNDFHHGPRQDYHDRGYHPNIHDNRRYNDGYFDPGYGQNHGQHEAPWRPLEHQHRRPSGGGSFGQNYARHHAYSESRDEFGGLSPPHTIPSPPKQRAFKPFVPGAQVPDDQDVSDLVCMPLDPALRVEVPRRSGDSDRSMALHPHARDRNGSITYGADWASPQMSPAIRREGFGMLNNSPSQAGHGTPTPPPSHATSGSPDPQDVRRHDFGIHHSDTQASGAPPTPSETPVDETHDEFEDENKMQRPQDDTDEGKCSDFSSQRVKSPQSTDLASPGFDDKDLPTSPRWDAIREDKMAEDFSTPLPTAATFGSSPADAPTDTPTLRTFEPPEQASGSHMADTFRASLWADGYERESYVGSSLHSSFIDNYVHSWNGDLDAQYRERYPQFFSDSGQPLFLGIADGGDDASMKTDSPQATPNPEMSSKNLTVPTIPTVPEPSMDGNWPLPAAPAPPREKKRPPPLKFDGASTSPPRKGSWSKVDEEVGVAASPVGIGIIGAGIDPPGTPRTPRTPRSVQPRPKGQVEGREGTGFI
ncbi:hypothetical protein MKZ38_001207 [Zalerion maritima]|uniref:Uncharacterized protein n=1 Tax=Zalerion maritima TaxID=339359 RepID=A0AAD5RZ86_9PEZI|nr:hypothetical protein MKZ38_001207 [Zalerion maritima]